MDTPSVTQLGAGKIDGWRFGENVDDAFARATPFTNDDEPTERLYSAPVLSPDEFKKISIPFGEISRLQGVLDENGFAIVTGVVPSVEELAVFENEFTQDLLNLIDKEAFEGCQDVKETYADFFLQGAAMFPFKPSQILSRSAGFWLGNCIPHGKFAWKTRRYGRVHDIFSALFPEDDNLVTSLDAVFFTPPSQEAETQNLITAHVDQNLHDKREALATNPVYQGALYIWPSVPDGSSSTTVVWPGSHKDEFHKLMEDEMCLKRGARGSHYTEISAVYNDDLKSKLTQGWKKHARRIIAPPGSLVLWNSRTIHTGWKGGPRLAQPVCLEPRSRQTNSERFSKLRLAALGLPSTHWASYGMQHDMMLHAKGVFANTGDRDIGLRPCLYPEPLSKTADLDELEKIKNVKFETLGIWKCPPCFEQVLENSVKDEFKPYL